MLQPSPRHPISFLQTEAVERFWAALHEWLSAALTILGSMDADTMEENREGSTSLFTPGKYL